MSALIDFEQTAEFLSLIEPDWANHEFCFMLLPYAKHIYGTLGDQFDNLAEWNKLGRNVFVCVNAITPVLDNSRPIANVMRVRAVFADFDDPAEPLPEFPLVPSILVESSPSKFHAYWLADGVPLDQFDPLQRGIMQRLGSNADRSIRGLNHVLRVPGFAHVKDPANPKPVRLLDANGRRYSYAELVAAFPPVHEFRGKFDAPPWDGVLTRDARSTLALVEANWGPLKSGKANVPCPWSDEHSENTAGSSTVYYAPSDDNAGRGGFKCLHAHCVGRGIEIFESWLREQDRRVS
ncbi:DNA-primase RepB domain-containing protein [Variovorax humicola]|uniref:DNA-primase RepB domain-containing protein n=1 Tax=Variovorax humicola TaxID=1769758 RepID=A0ABU8W6F2_9BURK